MIRSRAFVYHRQGDVRLGELELECGHEDLLVKVLASARCGTDKTIFRKGHYKVDSHAPVVLGHELVGEIIEVGRHVRKLRDGIGYKEGKRLPSSYLDFRAGERVTFQSRIAKYKDGLMILDEPITILSFYINGGYSEYMKVPPELIRSGSVLRLPDSASDEEGALVEPAACALESVFSTPHPVGIDPEGRQKFHAGIKPGGLSCVIGSGTVSMIYALLCFTEGARDVWMLVRSPAKAELVARALGNRVKTVVCEPYSGRPLAEKEEVEEGIVEKFREATAGELFDDVISACPSADAQRLMLKLYRPGGYAVGACFGGTHETADGVPMDNHHYRAAKTIGTSGCSTRSMETIIEWLRAGRLSLKGLVSPTRFSLRTEPGEFFTTGAGGLKPVLYPWD